MTTPHLRKSIGLSPWRLAFLLIPLVLACFGLSPIAQAADGDLGAANTAEGSGALQSLTTGIHNTALGSTALFSNATGNLNTATGSAALKNNTGDKNTADGFQALFKNTIGFDNTATGFRALYLNTMGQDNTATGFQALLSNTTGNDNAAVGEDALFRNTMGTGNTAVGQEALFSNTSGNNNTAVGEAALFRNTGSDNIALGSGAGQNLTTGDSNIYIGNVGFPGESGTIRIGGVQTATFIAGISGTAVGTDAVFVATNGHLGTGVPSSARFKTEIKPMDKASEAILALKPVTFRYKQEIDPKTTLRFGLVAEEVEKVNPDLVGRDAKGQVNTVHYEAVNAMLLNEFLKEHRKVTELETTVVQQRKDFEATVAQQQKDFQATAAHQQKQIEALTAGLQKVSAQVETSKPAPQTVLNNQ